MNSGVFTEYENSLYLWKLASYPGSIGEGETEPGINCVCMRLNSFWGIRCLPYVAVTGRKRTGSYCWENVLEVWCYFRVFSNFQIWDKKFSRLYMPLPDPLRKQALAWIPAERLKKAWKPIVVSDILYRQLSGLALWIQVLQSSCASHHSWSLAVRSRISDKYPSKHTNHSLSWSWLPILADTAKIKQSARPKWAVFRSLYLIVRAHNRASDREPHRQQPDVYLPVLNSIFIETEFSTHDCHIQYQPIKS